ncbi:MAG: mechanosensitive ion channel family protein [Nitrososphaerota archaeon]|nr:mechanosensitive ion channel family protein [Candidatus Calditenuaceae archaeon]MDW8072836.1 mechanosensitive ion channel family protein [Nitrososphaerota archaeon]
MEEYLYAGIAFAVILSLGFLARRILTRIIRGWAERTESKLDDVILGVVRSSIILWFLIGGVYAAASLIKVPPQIGVVVDRGLLAFLILSVAWTLANLASGMIRYYGSRIGAAIQVTSLGQVIAKIAILSLAIVIVLSELGIEITPLVASLGIGALAVALALQDTLANFFSGFYILAEKSIRVGDFVSIEGVGEGTITDISWRTTKIQTLANNLLIIPNKKLAESIVTNYDMPGQEIMLSTVIGVGYGEDPDRVEQILLDEAAKAVKEIPGATPNFTPLVRLAPAEYSLNFTVIWMASSVRERGQQIHEMNKRLIKRLKAEEIEIPFPVRTLYIRREEAPPIRQSSKRIREKRSSSKSGDI